MTDRPACADDPLNCFNCGKLKERSYIWFCNRCTTAKEKAYQECREAGVNTFGEVVLAREKALAEARVDQMIQEGMRKAVDEVVNGSEFQKPPTEAP